MVRLVKKRAPATLGAGRGRARSWALGEDESANKRGPRLKGARGPRQVRETVKRTAELLRVMELSEAELLAARVQARQVVENYEILIANGNRDAAGYAAYVRSVRVTHDAIDAEIHRRRLASGDVRKPFAVGSRGGKLGRPIGSLNKKTLRLGGGGGGESSDGDLVGELTHGLLTPAQRETLSWIAVGLGYDTASEKDLDDVRELVVKGYLARKATPDGSSWGQEVVLTEKGVKMAKMLAGSSRA